MSNSNVETVSSSTDRIKLGLAVLVIVAGIVGYSMLEAQPTIVRVGVFLGSLVLAALIAWFSEPGRRTLSFGRDSYNEVKRVVWPTRKESTQMTGIVFVFVAAMGLLLWVVDKGLEWVIYGLLLGWK
ncbi:preprotein translocase subunit SecE [Pollutimonas sp. M17]|uniref:preprotein translocase subunit SecE n=1 Tax=Pollutimonas sp. M17 TaxID=2962065 RepID=UPI0021F4B76B|nr:preprotein translocase subunit SecE [Pollutimonas sp. M17]UYO93718.1 preprotein translocase subunit SecE [Pollutimonas sp. M17]